MSTHLRTWAAATSVSAVVVVLVWPHFLEAPIARLTEFIQPASLRVAFVGDIMLDRAVAAHAERVGDQSLFAGVAELFATHDVVVGNLEGTITTNPSVSRVDPTVLRFTFAPRFASVLRDVGFSVMSLANNHSYDFGIAGYEDTLQYLSQAGIEAFGSPLNTRDIFTELSVRGNTLCLVGYHQLFDPDPTAIVEALRARKTTCAHIVLMAHWGVEYEHEPSAQQRELAHAFVDAGADVVIGAHPHVVQPLEIYNNHAIFYSLGNFIFDQGWQSEVRRGVVVGVEFGDTHTTFTLSPVTTYKEAVLADEVTAKAVLADLGVDSPTLVLKN